jgi:4-amino-4-deoxy-L-arabinose transferase-like glycosyltransferase
MTSRTRVLLLLLTLGGGVLRFARLGSHSLWLDEIVSLDASRDLRHAVTSFTHPPLPYLLLHLWTRLFGTSDAALRSLAALAGTLSIPLIFLVARRAFRRDAVALTAAGLLAVMPEAIWHSREVRHYTLWPAFVLLALWAVLGQRESAPPLHATVVYWLATALGMATHYYMAFYAAAHAVGAWLVIGERPLVKRAPEVRRWLRLHLPLLAVPLLLAVYRWWVWGALRGLGAAMTRPGTGARALWWLSTLVFFRPWGYADAPREAVVRGAVLAAALVLAVPLMLRDRRVDRQTTWALVVVLWLPLLLIELLPIRSYARLLAPTLPVVTLWLAYLAWVPLPWRLASAARVVAIASFLVLLAPYCRAVYTLEIEPWKTVCADIAAGETADTVVLVNEPFMRRPLARCYTARAPIVGFPNRRQGLTPGTVRDLMAKHDDVWFIYSHAWRTDPRRQGVRSLFDSYDRVDRHRYSPLIDVYHLRRADH